MRVEQPSTIPFLGGEGEQGMVLEGLYVPGSREAPSALIAPPHPLYGGTSAACCSACSARSNGSLPVFSTAQP